MEKRYKVRISFGDGNPIEDSIIARSGVFAQDIAMQRHPGARNVHLIGIDNRYETVKPIPVKRQAVISAPEKPLLFTDTTEVSKDSQIQCCVQMRKQGKSHQAIAGYLGVSKSTVGRWLKQYG